MAVKEGFGGPGRIGLDEAAVAVGPVVDQAVGLLLYPADDFHGLADITSGIARRVRQRHEHLFGLGAMLMDVVLDDGVPAVKAARVPNPPEDAVVDVALLSGDPVIII